MKTLETSSSWEQAISSQKVRTFRQCAMALGYRPVTVRTGSKAPQAPKWQNGEEPASLLDVRPEGTQTGCCCVASVASISISMITNSPSGS